MSEESKYMRFGLHTHSPPPHVPMLAEVRVTPLQKSAKQLSVVSLPDTVVWLVMYCTLNVAAGCFVASQQLVGRFSLPHTHLRASRGGRVKVVGVRHNDGSTVEGAAWRSK